MPILIMCHGMQVGSLHSGSGTDEVQSPSHRCSGLEDLHCHLVSLLAEAARVLEGACFGSSDHSI